MKKLNLISPVALVALILATGCTADTSALQPVESTSTSSPIQTFGEIPAVDAESSGTGQIELLRYRIQVAEATAACMSELGFDQLERATAEDDDRQVDSRVLFDSLEDPTVDFWPASEAEAALGSPPTFDQRTVVRSNNNDFDENLDDCQRGAETAEQAEAAAQLGELAETAYVAYTSQVDEVLVGVLDRWSECLAGLGFPVRDSEALWEGAIPQAFGVESGDVPRSPAPPNLKASEIRIERPPTVDYSPTDEEVALARADLTCKELTGFFEAIREALSVARVGYEQRHGSTRDELITQLLGEQP